MQLTKKQIITELWSRGELSYKLDLCQKELRDLYYNGKDKINVWLLARRNGKSFTLLTLALEVCIRKERAIVKYIAPTRLQVNTIIRPLFKIITDDCPSHLRPEFKKNDYTYYFPNGSEIQMAGADNGHAEKLRGGDADLVILDEAGSIDGLDYIVKSILLPTTLITKGKMVLASTPPKESEHDFLSFIEDAELRNTLIKKTIYDNPRLTPEDIQELKTELGGDTSDSFRRECLCELIKDSTTSVLPEFTPELEKEIVKDWPKPPFYDAYVSMDLGYNDLTGVLFLYYDFRAGKVIVEDELLVDFTQQDNTIPKLSQEILKKEKECWYNPLTDEVKKPYLRVSDINHIVTSEIYKESKRELHFTTPQKDDNDAAINNLRVMLANKKIIIHPRCTNLIRHLRNVKWGGKTKTTFARSAENGHYDLVDALKYAVRSVVYTKNPYPAHYDLNMKDLYIHNPSRFSTNPQMDVYKKIFGFRSK